MNLVLTYRDSVYDNDIMGDCPFEFSSVNEAKKAIKAILVKPDSYGEIEFAGQFWSRGMLEGAEVKTLEDWFSNGVKREKEKEIAKPKDIPFP